MTLPLPQDRWNLTRPASEFYWSVLALDEATPKSRHMRPSRDYLDSLFEEDLPVGIDEVHAVYAPLPDGRFIACAAPRSRLACIPPEALSLTPQSVPEAFSVDGGAVCNRLNLLTGEFEPRELRRERSRRWTITAAACVACTVLTVIGLARRTIAVRHDARDLDAASVELAKAALPGRAPTLATASSLIGQELSTLRPLHAANASTVRSPDAVAPLVDLLTHLPRTTSLRTDVLAVTPQTITLNVATDADPQVFLKGLTPPSGWALDEPRLTASRGEVATTLAIQMRRTPQSTSTSTVAGGPSGGAP